MMIRASGDSHVTYGSVSSDELVEAESILFKVEDRALRHVRNYAPAGL
jgi:hypothetical protein